MPASSAFKTPPPVVDAEAAAGDALACLRDVLRQEAAAIERAADGLGRQRAAVVEACDLIRVRCRFGGAGRLVVTGVGKAGKIADKLAATFASTGTPALFLHPAEARHGDLGMVGMDDVVLAVSNSGSSEEVLALLPSFKRIGVPVVALTGRSDSPLARHADVVLSIGRVAEACPLGLAPSTSTTALLALGDGLALTIQRQRRFTSEQYARFHPGGALGRALMTCAEAMRTGARLAPVAGSTPIGECLRAISRSRGGCVQLVDAAGRLLGVFTDGDLRRLLERLGDCAGVLAAPVAQHASMPCKAIHQGELLSKAVHLCNQSRIDELPVVDDDGRLVGLIDLQDLANRGFEVV